MASTDTVIGFLKEQKKLRQEDEPTGGRVKKGKLRRKKKKIPKRQRPSFSKYYRISSELLRFHPLGQE